MVAYQSLAERQLAELRYAQALIAERDRLRADRERAYQTDPVGWIETRLSEEVWSKQAEVMDALVQHRRVAVRSCHNVGKSHIASRAVAWWLSTYPDAFVVTTAPTFNQVKVVLWRYIRRAHRQHGLVGRTNQTEWLIDEEIVAYGRKPADYDATGFQGIHAAHVLVIIDEACGVPDALWDAADSLASNEGCKMLAIGNPDIPGTRFELISQPGSSWHPVRISAFDSPNLTGEPVSDQLKRLLISKVWVEEKALDWGVENPVYISKVLGEFPSQDPFSVVRIGDVNACRLVELDIPYHPSQLLPVELGVDVGGGGDLTVVRERQGPVSAGEWTSRSDRPEQLAPWIVGIINQTGATSVKIDSIGIGWGLVGELRNAKIRGEHTASIFAVNVSESPTDKAVQQAAGKKPKYRNLRSQIWWEVGRGLLAARQADLSKMDNADQTVSELLVPRYTENTAGQIEVESKDDIRKRQHGRSPDHADAWLLAYYQPPGTLTGFADQLLAKGAAR